MAWGRMGLRNRSENTTYSDTRLHRAYIRRRYSSISSSMGASRPGRSTLWFRKETWSHVSVVISSRKSPWSHARRRMAPAALSGFRFSSRRMAASSGRLTVYAPIYGLPSPVGLHL